MSEIDSASSGGDSGRDSSNELGQKKGGEFDNINVVVRVRPLHGIKYTAAERNRDQSSLFPAAGQIQVTDPQSNEERLFTFNVVFEPEASQLEVFEHCGIKRLIDMALEGFACTAFAYGQTGSGKTFTLSGNLNETVNRAPTANGESRELREAKLAKEAKEAKDAGPPEKTVGLIQLGFAYLFEQIKIKRQLNVTYLVTASYLEVYNEQVLDLLNPSGKALQVRWNKLRGFYAENLFKVECEDAGDLQGVLEEGMKNRQFRAHEMNEHSSRSHTLLTIALHSRTSEPEDSSSYITRLGRLCLVDLAGSEKTKRTKASRETLVEANRINSSLLALGNCISSLASAKKRTGHIPYRDSTLTKLLADSLSGKGLTLMIACVSPSLADASETISTLRYAARAKKVRTNPVIRMDPRELLILSLRREVRLLRMENNYLRHQMNLSGGFYEQRAQPPNPARLAARPLTGDSQTSDGASHPGSALPSTLEPKTIAAQLGQLQLQLPAAAAQLAGTGEPGQRAELDLPKEPGQIVVQYMQENEGLRSENAQLHLANEQMLLDLEQMNRENERLKVRMSAQPVRGVAAGEEQRRAEQSILRSIMRDDDDEEEELGRPLDQRHTNGKNGTFNIRRGSLLDGAPADGVRAEELDQLEPLHAVDRPDGPRRSILETRVQTGRGDKPKPLSNNSKKPPVQVNQDKPDPFASLELRGKSAISFTRLKR